MKRALILAACLATTTCSDDDPTSPDGPLQLGTWGGNNVAVLVEDFGAHVHVACTNGDFPAPITVDADGRFSVPGSYMLRAYPIAIGPTLPAQFAGVTDGKHMSFTVAVNDTVEKKLVVLGPYEVQIGKDPQMGPCPICDRRALLLRLAAGALAPGPSR